MCRPCGASMAGWARGLSFGAGSRDARRSRLLEATTIRAITIGTGTLEVCSVDCFYVGENMLVIDPDALNERIVLPRAGCIT
jgi:hypothetical protein